RRGRSVNCLEQGDQFCLFAANKRNHLTQTGGFRWLGSKHGQRDSSAAWELSCLRSASWWCQEAHSQMLAQTVTTNAVLVQTFSVSPTAVLLRTRRIQRPMPGAVRSLVKATQHA